MDQPIEQPASEFIRADRACAGCGFNLFGQPVTKEPHYDLAIARCPECGTVAALQQYPVMSHWVNRARAIIAAIYIVLLLGIFALSTLAISGFSLGSADIAANHLADHLGYSFTLWDQQQQQNLNAANTNGSTTTVTASGTTTVTTSFTPGSYQFVGLSQKWIDEQYPQARDSFGSLWKNKDTEMYLLFVPAAFVSFVIGCFWSITLLGASRKTVILVPIGSVLISIAFLFGYNFNNGYYLWATEFAKQAYIPMIVPLVASFELLWMILGVSLGRKLARTLVRIALPPRARVPLAILWTRDGLELPKPEFK